MIKMLLCCGGGFSSSALANAIKKGIEDAHKENEFSIDFLPITLGVKKIADYDIMICCPHLLFSIKKITEDVNNAAPVYILPPKMYGVINFEELACDVEDVIEIFNKTKTNPVYFPGEENIMTVPRFVAYRHFKKD